MSQLIAGTVILLTLCRCAPAESGASLQAANSYAGPCLPFGSTTGETWVGDPILDSTPIPTLTPDPEITPWPTCTPLPQGERRDPTPTALPTVRANSALGQGTSLVTAPQNLSLSPWPEHVHRVAAQAAGLQALTWQGDNTEMLTIWSVHGTATLKVSSILGVEAPAGVAVSPGGRIHLSAGGRYAYSDDGGSTWSTLYNIPAPRGDSHLVVSPDNGLARLLVLSDGSLQIFSQVSSGTWEDHGEIMGGVRDYDALATTQDVVVAAATRNGVYVWRWPETRIALPEQATHVALTYRESELVLGLGDVTNRAMIARSREGTVWETCVVYAGEGIASVAGFPAGDGYAVFWVWERPGGIANAGFPYIALSSVRWPSGEGCTVHPSSGAAAPPGLFYTRAQQTRFRIEPGARFLAFDGGSTDKSDVFIAFVSPNVKLGGVGEGSPGENAP